MTASYLQEVPIDTDALRSEVYRLIKEAAKNKEEMGAVNWGDLGLVDIEYRASMLECYSVPFCVVIIEEASPDSLLASWINERLDPKRFPNTYVECEW